MATRRFIRGRASRKKELDAEFLNRRRIAGAENSAHKKWLKSKASQSQKQLATEKKKGIAPRANSPQAQAQGAIEDGIFVAAPTHRKKLTEIERIKRSLKRVEERESLARRMQTPWSYKKKSAKGMRKANRGRKTRSVQTISGGAFESNRRKH